LESLFMILALDGTAGDSVELRRESTMCRLWWSLRTGEEQELPGKMVGCQTNERAFAQCELSAFTSVCSRDPQTEAPHCTYLMSTASYMLMQLFHFHSPTWSLGSPQSSRRGIFMGQAPRMIFVHPLLCLYSFLVIWLLIYIYIV
jgi:hypothetical protein